MITRDRDNYSSFFVRRLGREREVLYILEKSVSLQNFTIHATKVISKIGERPRAASEFLNTPLAYDDIGALRDRMEEISPVLRPYDVVEPTSLVQLSKVQLVDEIYCTKMFKKKY
jgi:hypothetical protein